MKINQNCESFMKIGKLCEKKCVKKRNLKGCNGKEWARKTR